MPERAPAAAGHGRHRRESEVTRALELLAGAVAGLALQLVPGPLPRLADRERWRARSSARSLEQRARAVQPAE